MRVLQEKEIVRVGGTKPISINVRIIAATNVNLEKGIATGTFREDLYYRLNRMPIHIPPLRKRKEDIPALCSLLISKNQDYGRHIEGVSDTVLKRLYQYDWPGNVRELENVLGRAIIFMKKNETLIDVNHLPDIDGIALAKESGKNVIGQEIKPLSEMIDSYEEAVIKQSLELYNGNKTHTAKALGVSVRNLYYKLKKYNLE